MSVKENAATLDLKKGRNLLVFQIHHTEGQGGVIAGIYGPASIVINDDVDRILGFSSAIAATASTIPSPSAEKQFKAKDGQVLPPDGGVGAIDRQRPGTAKKSSRAPPAPIVLNATRLVTKAR